MPNGSSETIRLWCEITFILKSVAFPANLANELLMPWAVLFILLLELFPRGP